MTKLIAAQVSDEFLASGTAFSDRFVYSNYFIPLQLTFDNSDVPIVPFATKAQLLQAILGGVISEDKVKEALAELRIDELWDDNGMQEALDRLRDSVSEELQRLEAVSVAVGADGKALALIAQARPAVARPTILGDQSAELVAGLLWPRIGYAFLDRTRIRPSGFAIGEHVYALGLAPGEEVILEQKTYSKRQVSFEEESEQETQFDLELSSTFTTELEEGLDFQHSRSDTWGLGISHTGSYQSPIISDVAYGQFNASHTINYTKNVSDADQESRRRSVKDGQTASSKVTSRYRTQHKTTFKVSKEEGFETTSKRTVRNPNRATPITLHYFKVLQRLEMTQQRYGARLCWAPAVPYPSFTFLQKISNGRQAVLDQANQKLPPRPVEPTPPNAVNGTTQREQKTFVSARTLANTAVSVTDGQSSDYDVEITIGTGWTWDGKIDKDNIKFSTARTAGTFYGDISGIPVYNGSSLSVTVHIGAQERPSSPPIYFQVEITALKDLVVGGMAGQDPGYQAALDAWRASVKDWENARDDLLSKAHADADAFEEQARAHLSPVNEMLSQIIGTAFDPVLRDDASEIEFWQRVFDWERASILTFPSWWSLDAMPDPTLDPSDFINASWAVLYLPVRPGMELMALRWIVGKAKAMPMDARHEKAFARVIADLDAFRKQQFGTPDEQPLLTTPCQEISDDYPCIAKWSDFLPTDGTHIEVVQSATTAADSDTRAEIDDAAALRTALNESEKRSAAIKDKAIDKMTTAAKLDVQVSADGQNVTQ